MGKTPKVSWNQQRARFEAELLALGLSADAARREAKRRLAGVIYAAKRRRAERRLVER
jgi:hypothetical protein